ncbi:hypothetical protein Gotur_024001 [Gossypium turneri]
MDSPSRSRGHDAGSPPFVTGIGLKGGAKKTPFAQLRPPATEALRRRPWSANERLRERLRDSLSDPHVLDEWDIYDNGPSAFSWSVIHLAEGYVSELWDFTRINVTQNNLQELKEKWDQWDDKIR